MEIKGSVFNIEHYAVHDGPGIRTLVFLKGCPLRCLWCCNPESQSAKTQLMMFKESCIGCGACIAACPNGAITADPEQGLITDREKCNLCLKCVDECYANGRAAIDAAAPADKEAAIEQAIADYTALVKELSSLLADNEPASFVYSRISFPILYNTYRVTSCPGGFGANTFAEFVRNATSSTIIKKMDASTGAEQTYEGEPYHYYDSPYVIYYKWMQKFSFLPAEKND